MWVEKNIYMYLVSSDWLTCLALIAFCKQCLKKLWSLSKCWTISTVLGMSALNCGLHAYRLSDILSKQKCTKVHVECVPIHFQKYHHEELNNMKCHAALSTGLVPLSCVVCNWPLECLERRYLRSVQIHFSAATADMAEGGYGRYGRCRFGQRWVHSKFVYTVMYVCTSITVLHSLAT